MINFKRIIHYLLLLAIIAYIVTGFGITNYQLIGMITFGLLTKGIPFQIHSNLIIPLIILLIAHIYLTIKKQ